MASGSVDAAPSPSGRVLVSDALARALVASLFEAEAFGIALLRGPEWTHVMSSDAYDRFLGEGPTVGRPLTDVLSELVAPAALLERVIATGRPATAARTFERIALVDGVPGAVHIALTFLPMRASGHAPDGVLVLAYDVSRQQQEHRLGELFVALAYDMSGDGNETASVRSSVAAAARSLHSDASSLFLLSPDRKSLRGALLGWDWTRTSFVADVEKWPTVRRALAENAAAYVTAATAANAEEAWFERRGIQAAICAPMAVEGRPLGILFFDYFRPRAEHVDLDLAKQIADQCGRLVERAAARHA